MAVETPAPPVEGLDDDELAEWFESLDDVAFRHGGETLRKLLAALNDRAAWRGVRPPLVTGTPYVNTIPPEEQPEYPGNRELDDRLMGLVRWNAMAIVHRANRDAPGIGGHLASFASLATLSEVGWQHVWRARTKDQLGDLVYFHGHSSPGMYARAFLEGRLTAEQLDCFRRESPRETGLSSYPHPWLMPHFWQFPTVSMGLGPIQAIYQARFLRYLGDRGVLDTSDAHVWCLAGDGEMDEPESVAALGIAARERLDNLTLIVNCNLQRLDGPVRGNGKIVQELESRFRGAGWNCIKIVWGSGWDGLLARDEDGRLVQRLNETVDGQFQKYTVEGGDYFRDDFWSASDELRAMVEHLSDDELAELEKDRGGHDPLKVYAAYDAARKHEGAPTVILAHTIKGHALGPAGEGVNVAHKTKKLEEEHLKAFRDHFNVPLSDEDAANAEYARPDDDSEEIRYLKERRDTLGGFLPERRPTDERLGVPPLEDFGKLLEEGEASTTLAFGRLLTGLLKDESLGERVVPIIPDEARTFGLEALFGHAGIYTHQGQRYEPVDADKLIHYHESRTGQLLEEGITEAGAMSSFIAAGTAYANLGLHMVPFYLFYSMFGFQRVGDLIWAAGDARARGFLLGCTAGRTTLNGEGLQHQDGHSPLVASTVPTLRAYDPAYAYEVAVIVRDGLRRMYAEDEDVFYYLTLYNESYPMPALPEGDREGILRGMYRVGSNGGGNDEHRPQLFGSGSILPEAERAQTLLADEFDVAGDLWSVTSYSELRRDALAVARWNDLHPEEEPRRSYLDECLGELSGRPFVAATDYMKAVPDQIARWLPGPFRSLGTDGFGRSDTRPALRTHFEVNAEWIAYAALCGLAEQDAFDPQKLPDARRTLDVDPEKADPVTL